MRPTRSSTASVYSAAISTTPTFRRRWVDGALASLAARTGAAPQVDVSVKGEAKSFAPPRLLSHLFAQLRGDAEANTGENVKEAVLVVPAHFSEVQRAALKESAQIGGVRVKMLLSSPLCAALLYAHTAASPEPPPTLEVVVAAAPRVQQLLVVDVGGSGIEAAVVERTISATAKGRRVVVVVGRQVDLANLWRS